MISPAKQFNWERWKELARFYQAAIVNTAFGLGLYYLFVAIGLDRFVAQLSSHLLGMAFNYLSYSTHVFRAARPAMGRFVISYALNYGLGVAALYAFSKIVENPYVAGTLAMGAVSIINFFMLKLFVFQGVKP